MKSQSYEDAANILAGGAKALLQAGQGGSGGDLAMMLMTEVYNKAEWPVDQKTKGVWNLDNFWLHGLMLVAFVMQVGSSRSSKLSHQRSLRRRDLLLR